MVNAQGAYGDGPCVLAGINAIDERDGERVVLEIVVRSGPDSS